MAVNLEYAKGDCYAAASFVLSKLKFPYCHQRMVPQTLNAVGKLLCGKVDASVQPFADQGSGTGDGKFKYKIQVLLIQFRKFFCPFVCGASTNKGRHASQELWIRIAAHENTADIPVFADTFK